MKHLSRSSGSPPLVLLSVLLVVSLSAPDALAQSRHVYWTESQTGKITRAELDGSNPRDVVAAAFVLVQSIDVDREAGKIYWADYDTGKIQRANLDGSNVEDLLTGQLSPGGMALDSGSGKMYWKNGAEIWRASLDGSDTESLLTVEGPTYSGIFDIALDVDGQKMYWAVGTKVHRANLDGSAVEVVVPQDGSVIPLDVALDVAAGKLYWTDNQRRIRRADLDGTNLEEIFADSFSKTGLAVDAAGGKLYWTSSDGLIRRSNLDGTQVESVGMTGLYPYGFALDLTGNRMYWSTSRAIQSAGLDGTDVQTLITTPVADVRHLVVDEASARLYWIDGAARMIQRANLDGTDIEDIIVATSDPKALAVRGDKIYWVHANRLHRADVDGTNQEEINPAVGFVTSMALDPQQEKLYWTVGNDIRRAKLDGTGVEDVHTGQPGPSGLALDPGTGTMYWGVSGGIRRGGMDGGDVQEIVTGLSRPYGLAVDADGGKVYWTDVNFGKVQRANLDGSAVEDVAQDLLSPWGVALDLVVRTAKEDEAVVTQTPVLEANYPNPFNPETVIRYSLPRAAHVSLRVFDLRGAEVATLVDREQGSGLHRVRWSGTDRNGLGLASGVYLYRLEADGFVESRSMLLVR